MFVNKLAALDLKMSLLKKENQLVFYVNGIKVEGGNVDPEITLLTYLRRKLRLTGTKLGCSEGGCGACTVMVSKYNWFTNIISHYTVNACLMPACMVHGMSVTTVEGIGNVSRLHPVQERLAKSHGSQCGFCTPGIIMSMYTLLRNNPSPSSKEIESAFEGNLCRCTGYRPILDGFKTLSKDSSCCRALNGGTCCKNGDNSKKENGESMENGINDFIPYDPSQEPIFPPELKLNAEKISSQSIKFVGERVTYIRPVTLEELLDLKRKYPFAKMVVGNTEVGIEVKFKNMLYPVIISPIEVPELNCIEFAESGIIFGAACSLTCLDGILKKQIITLPEWKVSSFSAIVEMLRWFAGHQVRNVASIGGNIMTSSPISDLNPLFVAAGVKLNLQSCESGRRTVIMDDKFFTGYRKNIVRPDEILVSIHLPYSKKGEYIYGYKQSPRREDDIAIVNAGMRVLFDGLNIKEIVLCYGGMAPTTVIARNTMEKLAGRAWNEELLSNAMVCLADEISLSPDAPGGMVEYRKTLTASFFFKFYLAVLDKLPKTLEIPENWKSAIKYFEKNQTRSTQFYQVLDNVERPGIDMVGRPMLHTSALKQATGEAIYCDDVPLVEGELFAALVLSQKAHANILNVDTSKALSLTGVHSYINHEDIPAKGSNITGYVVYDDEVFASKKVTCVGQVIGLILAESKALAQRAAKLVQIDYEEVEPIITIEDAIKKGSYYNKDGPIKIEKGDIENGFLESDNIIEGEMRVGGQEHFYLETQACICYCKEDEEMEVVVSTQSLTPTQKLIARALGVQSNKIVCRVKRMGGGFGGKESRSCFLSTACAVAAKRVRRAVRCMLDRDEDMCSTGTRHPFLAKYKVGFMKSGKLKALDIQLYSNVGNTHDLSESVMERALFHSDNAYYIPNVRVRGYLCKTNLPSNTAFRGFGGPQAMMFTEAWITHVAEECGIHQNKVREINMYTDYDRTHFNQTLYPCTIDSCWKECLQKSEYEIREKEIIDFNEKNRWRKKGMSIIPTKFGIAFTSTFLNQAGALVHVYTDGSVLLAHGGTEMGQGLHTKMTQIASRELMIPPEKIHICETSTATVPNTSSTAASASSDLNGAAIKIACEKIIERLKPYVKGNPKGHWDEWVCSAYMDRVSLSATGFYRTPDIDYDWERNSGNVFNYFCYGVACSEVEIDCLTGDHTVLRTDIVMDVGKSINPVIDIGQIEGGFVQGYGLFTLEDQRWTAKGELLTKGPGMYKIPGFNDIPVEFNVSLLANSDNPKAIYSSKAIGEPPLFLASSVFYAIKDAIFYARKEVGLKGNFRIDSPATAERIRMACSDQFTERFPAAAESTYKAWFVRV